MNMYKAATMILILALAGCGASEDHCEIAGFEGNILLKGLLSHAELEIGTDYGVSLTLYAPQSVVSGPLLTVVGQGKCDRGVLSVRFEKAQKHNDKLRFISGTFTAAKSKLPEYGRFGLWDIRVEEVVALSPYNFAKKESDGLNYVTTGGYWVEKSN